MGSLSRLTKTLDKIQRRYGQHKRFPLYLTEFGYQTRPADPLGVPLRAQATYINQSEYIASRNKNVRALSQFLLVDDAPDPGYSVKTMPGVREAIEQKEWSDANAQIESAAKVIDAYVAEVEKGTRATPAK